MWSFLKKLWQVDMNLIVHGGTIFLIKVSHCNAYLLAKDFIRHLLVLDPRARYTAHQALNHPFITQYCGQAEATTCALRSATQNSHSSQGSLNESASGRPIGNKTPMDDSGCVTSNEKINQKSYPKEKAYVDKTGGSAEKVSKKGIFGQWFRGKSASKI
jgi:serine/threonine protein kinase